MQVLIRLSTHLRGGGSKRECIGGRSCFLLMPLGGSQGYIPMANIVALLSGSSSLIRFALLQRYSWICPLFELPCHAFFSALRLMGLLVGSRRDEVTNNAETPDDWIHISQVADRESNDWDKFFARE